MYWKLFSAWILVMMMLNNADVLAADLNLLKAGVVKIRATPQGESVKVGSGFIVEKKDNVIIIVTVAHVVLGDPNPQVALFPKANVFHKA